MCRLAKQEKTTEIKHIDTYINFTSGSSASLDPISLLLRPATPPLPSLAAIHPPQQLYVGNQREYKTIRSH